MRILLIEDELKIAQAIKRGLEQETFAVDEVNDGHEGYGRALAGKFDLLILDRMLPGISDGLEICRAMRKQGLTQPILLLTARDGTKDRVEGLDSGADDYLVKPFSFEELLARVRALLRRPDHMFSPVLKLGNLELHTETNEVRRGGKKIELSRKEFALLEFLMRHNGQAVSKDEIIQHVWNFDADILPNTVEAFVASLRQKIEKPFKESKIIFTVHGYGYKLQI
jgi:DNA-binding response OmpR family regulator